MVWHFRPLRYFLWVHVLQYSPQRRRPSRFADKYNSRYKIYQPAKRHAKICSEPVRRVQHSKAADGQMRNSDDPNLLSGTGCGRIAEHGCNEIERRLLRCSASVAARNP
jgi:hypothetical protein